MPALQQLKNKLRSGANPARAALCARYFKTDKGEYGHGDIFLGLTVPERRKIATQFYNLPLGEIQALLRSNIHEERFTALVILVRQFERGDEKTKKQIYHFYLKNAKRINNWDLVDTSAPQIVGGYLVGQSSDTVGAWHAMPLQRMANSPNLWERRIAILATFAFIRHNEFEPTLAIAKLLLNDKHDLIHKACGWMLREVGKSELRANGRWPLLKKFLDAHAHHMPRTMLRYAIEKLSKQARQRYLTWE